MNKEEVRKISKAKRLAMDENTVREKSLMIEKVFLDSEMYRKAQQIMLYMPKDNEVDTTGIIKAALSDGKRLVFPVTNIKTGEIEPYYAESGTRFIKGTFSIMEPSRENAADMTKTDVVIVPGIAFDKRGGRVGFGKGYYDRFLRKNKTVNIGLCYDFQVCEEIEIEDYDVKMNFLISEKGLLKCGTSF